MFPRNGTSRPVPSLGKIFSLSRCPFVPGQGRNVCPVVPKSCTVPSRWKPYPISTGNIYALRSEIQTLIICSVQLRQRSAETRTAQNRAKSIILKSHHRMGSSCYFAVENILWEFFSLILTKPVDHNGLKSFQKKHLLFMHLHVHKVFI